MELFDGGAYNSYAFQEIIPGEIQGRPEAYRVVAAAENNQALMEAFLQQLLAKSRSGHIECPEEASSAGIGKESREFRREVRQMLMEQTAHRLHMSDKLLLLDDFEVFGSTCHIHEIAAPGGVNAA